MMIESSGSISYIILVVHLQTKIPHLLLQIFPLHLHPQTHSFIVKNSPTQKQVMSMTKINK